jgi:Fic family protein
VVVRLRGQIHYRPPDAGVAEAETAALLAWLTSALKSDADTAFPVELAADFIGRLTSAHPFRDGNGRVARTVATWIIATCGYGAVRSSDLRTYFYVRAADYYDALARYQKDAEAGRWRAFFAEAVSACLSSKRQKIVRHSAMS